MKTASHIRYEIEWPTSSDCENPEFEFCHRPTLAKARAVALKKAQSSPLGVAYIERQVFSGMGLPCFGADWEWDSERHTREEVSI